MPHMGWNIVKPKNINNLVKEPQDYYFVHSYYFECKNDENILAFKAKIKKIIKKTLRFKGN